LDDAKKLPFDGSGLTLCTDHVPSQAELDDIPTSASLRMTVRLPDVDSRYEAIREAAERLKCDSERVIEETARLDIRVQTVAAGTMELGSRLDELVEEFDGIRERWSV
jgi:hypothetical protein